MTNMILIIMVVYEDLYSDIQVLHVISACYQMCDKHGIICFDMMGLS